MSDRKFVARSRQSLRNWKNGVLESQPGDLPPSPRGSACKVCGVACPEDARTVGRWRVCSAHETAETASRAALVAELTGVDLPADVADAATRGGLLTALVPFASTTETPFQTGNEHPWAHGVDVEALRRQALAVVPRTGPRPCRIGPCAWCGVRLSSGWSDHGHRRSDGTPAPLCASCSPLYERYGEGIASSWRSQRVGLQAAATNGYVNGGEYPAEVPSHAERGGGDGTPWSHVDPDALRTLRLRCWARSGKYAPDEASRRAAALWARARQAEAAQARRSRQPPTVEF